MLLTEGVVLSSPSRPLHAPVINIAALLERTADAAFSVTLEGELQSWNRAAERLFGHAAADVLGRSCDEVFDGRGALGTLAQTDFAHVRECVAQGREVPDFDLAVTVQSGESRWINVSTLVLEDPHGGRPLIIHLARDIDARKQSEETIARMLRLSRHLLAIADESKRPAPVTPLSGHERRILRLFADGRSPAEIARDLNVTPQTLRNHLHHINQKLGTRNRLEAVMHALRRKLI